MATLAWLLLRHPLRTLIFTHSFLSQFVLSVLKRILLPHFPTYQPLRLQIQRAYYAAAGVSFPNLIHRLPVGNMSPRRARAIDAAASAYVMPGVRELSEFAGPITGGQKCVVLFAHGGGYLRGEARMYANYMDRWVQLARTANLDLVFLSVEYPLTTEASHPAQRTAFVDAYRYLLDSGVLPSNIVFMGDSAGGALSIISGLYLQEVNLPQPAASVLVSPWIDVALRSGIGGNPVIETDYVLAINDGVPVMASMFIGNHPADSPEVNPLYRPVDQIKGLNPQLIFCGAAEIARDDGMRWGDLCSRAGVEHKLTVGKAQVHNYALGPAWTDPAVRRETDDLIVKWIKNHVE